MRNLLQGLLILDPRRMASGHWFPQCRAVGRSMCFQGEAALPAPVHSAVSGTSDADGKAGRACDRGGRAAVLGVFFSDSHVFPCGTVHGHVPSLQAVSTPEDAPAESAPEKPSDAGEDGGAEDAADAGGRGGSGAKKEAPSSKAVLDGKLVKGAWPVGLGDGLQGGRGGGRPGC